jgi:uncharacterized protein
MNADKQFDQLKEVLNKHTSWPTIYMFKFIIPAENRKIALIESKFSETAIISQHESATGKYVSITVKDVMLSAEAVIEKYKEMKGIEGLIAL